MIERSSATYRNQVVEIVPEPGKRVMYGPALKLIDCDVELICDPDSIGLVRVEMMGCTVTAKAPVRDVNFTAVRFQDCRFFGEFSGCDFGHLTVPQDYGGALVKCDFTGAMLDECRIFDTELPSLHLPSVWPHIVFVGRFQAVAKKRLASASTLEERVFFKVLSDAHRAQSASLEWGPNFAARMNMSENQARAFIDGLPFLYDGRRSPSLLQRAMMWVHRNRPS